MTKYFRVEFIKGISHGDGEDEDFDPAMPPAVSLRAAVLFQHQKAYIGDECSEFSDFEELIDALKSELEEARIIARKKFAEEAHRREIEKSRAKRRRPRS